MPHWLLEPCLKDRSSVRGKGRASLFPTSGGNSHVGASGQMHVVPIETDHLGDAQACLRREQHQGVIAASEPRRAIGRGKYCLDLGTHQEMHLPLVVTLVRYRQNPLDQSAVGWLLKGYETEEGADGGQAQIAGPDAGTTLCLEIGKKRANEGRFQIFEFQGRRSLTKPGLRKREQ